MFHFHKWVIRKDTGKHKYLECRICRKRTIRERYRAGHQPVDIDWINKKGSEVKDEHI